MTDRPGPAARRAERDSSAGDEAAFPALLEDNIEDLYDNAPCGYLSTLLDGTVAKINNTLLGWLGLERPAVVGRQRFLDLLAVGSQLYHETHMAPLLRMQGEVNGIALELATANGAKLPVLVTASIRTDGDGNPTMARITVFDARDRRAYERELLRARQDAERERERLRLLVAALQRSLLPATLQAPPGLETAGHYHMASPDEVGGDFYDLFPLPDGRWGFFLGDVRGKGVDAAAVTSAARYTLRAAAVYDSDPVAVLSNLNSVLYQDYRDTTHRHCTVTFGILDPDGDGYLVTIAGGGHPPPLLLSADGTAEYQTSGGTLIGILPDPPLGRRTLRIAPGDTLVLYSDGLTESRVPGSPGERYGSDALLAFAQGLAPTTGPAAVNALVALLATFGSGTDDDVAVMAFSVRRT